MKSGVWKIIVSGNQLAVQRSITLTVGIPQTVVVTVSNAPLFRYDWFVHR